MINNNIKILFSLLFILVLGILQNDVLLVNAETDYAISPVSLLLPYTTSKYRKPYRLEANKGCFEWINTNPDLVEITPIYEQKECATPQLNTIGAPDDLSSIWDSDNQNNQKKCSKAVLVSVRASTSTERNSAFIYAEEQVTGKKLQCEVFVDKISSIVIETTTKTMYKDDLEELHVRAYDSVGNVFSSIVGLEFEWSIQAGNIIQIVPFRGFPSNDVALKMEQESLQTSFVLVQGVDTGSTQITTKLTDSNYVDISHSTTISILEPLQLNPSYLLYVIPGTQIQYQLLTKKRTVLENIPLPNPNYLWSSSNPKVGNIDNSGNFMALDLGRTDLKVQHKKMMENKVQAFVNVVNPSYLAIKIEPMKSSSGSISNWNLIEKRDYILVVELYDATGHKIHSSDITFDLVIPSEYFEPLPTSLIPVGPKRSDTYYLKAIKQGSVQLKASLLKVYDINLKKYSPLLNPISVEQMVTIHSQITINPPIVYLPYLPKNKQSYTIRPSGGSGEYHWYSNNTAVVTVDSNGNVVSQSSSGQTEVIVVDKKNSHNRDQAVVIIQEPDQIIFAPSPLEVEVGKKLELSTKLLSKLLPKGIYFDSCSIGDLEWKVNDDKVFQILPQDNSIPKRSSDLCSTREFLALREGSTVVSVQYKDMKEEIHIFAYPPLKSNHNEILLTLGSSAQIYFSGGPEPWYSEPSLHFQSIAPENSNDQSSHSIKSGNGNSFTITCLKHSSSQQQQNIIVTVGNKKSPSNPFPASPSISIPYYCRQPSSVQLQVVNLSSNDEHQEKEIVEQQSNASPSCQDTIFSIKKQKQGEIGTYKIRNDRKIPFIATVYDENGKPFTNYSSLNFDWSSSDTTQAKWLKDYNEKDHLSTLSLSKEQGKVVITVSIVGYNQDVLRQNQIYSTPSLDKLSSSLELHLLSSVALFPDRYTMYLNDKNHLRIEAIGGSKNFAFSSNTTKVATLSYQPNSDFVTVTPIQQGYIKVQVRDICLGGDSDSAQQQQSLPAIVQVSEAHSIGLVVKDMVQVGDSIDLLVKAFAQDGHEFESSQYQYMKILPHIDNPNVLSVTPSPSSNENNQVFSLKGLDQGIVTLTVTITNPKTGFKTSSKTIQIQVYPQFRVSPNTLHLVPKGLFQIHWTGGIPIRQEVTFESSDKSVASFNKDVTGELYAHKVGEAIVVATAKIHDPITNTWLTIGTDRLVVQVKNMTGIQIHSNNINTILVGNEVKLRVVGANNETPFTYGTVDLFFKWECIDTNIATLLPIYAAANTTVESEGSFSVRVVGKNPGTASISVYAYASSDKVNILFQASIQVVIIPDIPIQTTSLLLPLNTASSFIINNNLDKNGIEISPLGCGHSSCKDVINIKDNKINSLDKVGSCYVSVVRDGRVDSSKLLKVTSKPFSHLEILPINPTSTVIPIGETMSFSIYLRDDIGEIFSEYGGAVFNSEVSNTGIISTSIDSNVITIKGVRAGVVTLRVYLKEMPQLDDYIKIFVGRLIEPNLPIAHLGSTIQFTRSIDQISQRGFSLPLPNEKVWVSNNPSIISIDPVSGKAKALSIGTTTISYTKNPSSQTQVVVSKVDHIKVDFGNQIISNVKVEYEYKLKFFTESDSEFSDLPTVNQNIKGTCSIKESSFASAHFKKIILGDGKEQYMCVVKPTGKPTSTTDKVTLFVEVSNDGRSYHSDTVVSLPFESTFSILNVNSNNKIELTGKQSQYVLNIQSSNPIFVESSDNTLLSVQQLSSTGVSAEQGIYRYGIQPMNPLHSFKSIPLYISSADGKHKSSIEVSYDKSTSSAYTTYNETYVESPIVNRPIVITLIIVICTFAIGLYASKKHNDKPRVYISNNSISSQQPQQPLQSSFASPYRSQPPLSFASPNKSQYGRDSIYLQH